MSKLFYFSPTDENFPHTIQEIGREVFSVIREKTDEELYSQDKDTAPLPPTPPPTPMPPTPIPVTFHSVTSPGSEFPYYSEVDIRGYYEIWRTDTNEKVPGDLISYSVENTSNEMTPTSTPGKFKVTGVGSGNFVFTFTGEESEYSIDEKSIKVPFTTRALLEDEKQEPIIDTLGLPNDMKTDESHTVVLDPIPSDLDLSGVTLQANSEVLSVSGLTITAVGPGVGKLKILYPGNELYKASVTSKSIIVY